MNELPSIPINRLSAVSILGAVEEWSNNEH
jgi:hypothetical protein